MAKRGSKPKGNRGKSRSSRNGGRSDPVVAAIRDLAVQTRVMGLPVIRDQAPLKLRRGGRFTTTQLDSYGPISISSSVNASGAIYVTLSQFPLDTGFKTVFDQYRILQVTVRFVPLGVPPPGGGYNPLNTAIDYDDASPLTSVAAITAYDTCQETSLGQYVERTFTPRFAGAAYSGTFTSFTNTVGWIDIASDGVQHYGCKYFSFASATTIAAPLYTIEIAAILQFRSVR